MVLINGSLEGTVTLQVLRLHCLKNSPKGIFYFSEIFSGIQKSIVKYEEFEGCIEPDCI